jgi:mycobactin salicyl-AMP ligase
MTATLVTRLPADPSDDDIDPFGWRTTRLAGFVEALADNDPDLPLLQDQPDRSVWSRRGAYTLSCGQVACLVRAFVTFLKGIGLAPQAHIGVFLPHGSEACLTVLAIEQAGMVPCLLPIDSNQAEIAAAVEAANMQAVITQTQIGDFRPAEMMRHIGARYFGLRFLCAFGPEVPDGVIDLDRLFLALDEETLPPIVEEIHLPPPGFMTFTCEDGRLRPVHRSNRSILANAVSYLAASRIGQGERIVSLLPPDDLAGLVTSVAACVLGGALLESHTIFDRDTLLASLNHPCHLIVPGWMEDLFQGSLEGLNLASLTLVHRVPVRFRAKALLGAPVIDVLNVDEKALLCKARDAKGQPSFILADLGERGNAALRQCLQVQLEAQDRITLTGLSAEMRPFQRGETGFSGLSRLSQGTNRTAETFAGLLIGVL